MAFIPPPETVALLRRLYQDDVPIQAIVARTGVANMDWFYRCVDGGCPDGLTDKPAPLPRRRSGLRKRPRKHNRTALVERMWRTAERQVEEIEERLQVAGLPLADQESGARTLAIVARVLRELTAVDEAERSRTKDTGKQDDDDAAPRNVDDLRRALARKLEEFAARAAGDLPGVAQ